MKYLVILLLCLTTSAHARFGGSRSSSFSSRPSSGSYRSSSSSSFGGSRSTPGARISRPAPSSQSSAPSSSTHTTVIHRDSGSGFWSGMMWGSMMNRQPTVVVAGDGSGGQVVAPVVVQQDTGFFGALWIVFKWLLLFAVIIGIVVWIKENL